VAPNPTSSQPARTCADLLGALAQHPFQAGLVDEQPPARRQAVVDPDIEPGDDVYKLAPGEIVHRDERVLGDEILLRLQAHLVLDASGAKELDGPQMECAARGSGDALRMRSTAIERMPCCAKNIAVDRPTSPPPAMRTGTSAAPAPDSVAAIIGTLSSRPSHIGF
jgi:hypothetical protein